MQRLSRIAEGDPESTRYGLDLAHANEEHARALAVGNHGLEPWTFSV